MGFPPTLVNRLIRFPFGLMQKRFTRKKMLQARRRYRFSPLMDPLS